MCSTEDVIEREKIQSSTPPFACVGLQCPPCGSDGTNQKASIMSTRCSRSASVEVLKSPAMTHGPSRPVSVSSTVFMRALMLLRMVSPFFRTQCTYTEMIVRSRTLTAFRSNATFEMSSTSTTLSLGPNTPPVPTRTMLPFMCPINFIWAAATHPSGSCICSRSADVMFISCHMMISGTSPPRPHIVLTSISNSFVFPP